MSTTPPSRLSQDRDSPQGAFAGHVGRGLPARVKNGAPSIDSDHSTSTSALERFEDTVAFHVLRTFGITMAVMVLVGLTILAALRIAAAAQPNPWSVVQLAFAGGLAEIAQLIAGLSAALFLLALLIFVVALVIAAVNARVRQPGFRPRSKPPTGGGERE